jgi:SPP1 family predicted phage head-tail adaptor
MSTTRLKKKRRLVNVGHMRDRITFQNRSLEPPDHGLSDFDLAFSDDTERWAAVNTVTGKTLFDGVQGDVPVTHEILTRFDSTVTSETWVILSTGERIDILTADPLDERREFMLLKCRETGSSTTEAAKL